MSTYLSGKPLALSRAAQGLDRTDDDSAAPAPVSVNRRPDCVVDLLPWNYDRPERSGVGDAQQRRERHAAYEASDTMGRVAVLYRLHRSLQGRLHSLVGRLCQCYAR